MPIKTTGTGANRRIITKLVDGQRRVSCSCCEGCCMYPADQLGVGYQEADLPDEVRITIAGTGGDSRIAARSGSEYSYGSYGGIANLKLGVDGGAWVFIPNADNLSAYVQQCLNGEEAEFTVEDTFADTYTVNTYDDFIGGTPASSFVVTRQSLCIWSGFDGRYGGGTEVILEYNTPNENTTRATLWTMANNGRVDGGPYNSPVGSYVDGNYIWDVVE